jgi:hypothetical protein
MTAVMNAMHALPSRCGVQLFGSRRVVCQHWGCGNPEGLQRQTPGEGKLEEGVEYTRACSAVGDEGVLRWTSLARSTQPAGPAQARAFQDVGTRVPKKKLYHALEP